jgi:hypothetical protein
MIWHQQPLSIMYDILSLTNDATRQELTWKALHSVFVVQLLVRLLCVVNFVQTWKWRARWKREWMWNFLLNCRNHKVKY